MDSARAIRVLLIASSTAPTPAWRRGDSAFDVIREPDLDRAAERLAAGPDGPEPTAGEGRAAARAGGFDAVILDAGITKDPASTLNHLLGDSSSAAAVILSDDPPSCVSSAQRAWLPAGAPAEQQAELLCLAVERARLQQSAARSDARFRDVIERNADALVVMDQRGTIMFANRMAVALFGQSREDLIGSPLGFPAVAGETTELDLHADGHTHVVEMRVVESEWEGSAACIASLRDITHRKQAEENARSLIREQAARSVAEAAARRFRFLAESSTVLSASLDFRTTLSELARLFVSEIADWAVIYIVDDADRVRRLEVAHRDPERRELAASLRASTVPLTEPHPVLDVLRTRRPVLVREVDDARLMSLSGDPRHIELIRTLGIASFMVVPLTARNRSLGAIALIRADEEHPFSDDDLDLAEDLALRASLAVDNARLYHTAQEVNQTKSDLFAAISHDLRTPLNSIIGHADLLSMGIPETLGDASLRHVERIGKSAMHLIHLIDELLTLVRLEAGRETLNLADVDAADLISDVADVVELLAMERGLVFTTEQAGPALSLRTDPPKLRQVLLNLVGNAIKYTERGSVRLVVEHEHDTAVFQVIDTGVGIAPEDVERMFEPFWQADSARRTIDRGTGLGLSVVQRLVALLGGRIEVKSKPGSGSAFTVRLPLVPSGGTATANAFSTLDIEAHALSPADGS